MTEERRQPREQIASHIYRRPATATPHPTARRAPAAPARNVGAPLASARGGAARDADARYVEAPIARTRAEVGRRVVTKPDVAQSVAGERYIDRRNQLYSARAKAPAYPNPKARSFAQAVAAPGRPVGAIKRPMPRYHSSPIPVRSGRFHGRRKGFLWKILGMFGLLLLLVLGVNFALTSTAFRVAQVGIIGTHNAMLVSSIQDMHMQGQNIFLLDLAALTSRIDMLPLVASANIDRRLPNQLLVTVTERTPVLLWQTKYGTYSVDQNGVVIARANAATGARALMTVVDTLSYAGGKGTAVQAIQPGVSLNATDIAFAMAVFAGLPKATGITDFSLRYVGAASKSGNGSFQVVGKTGWVAYLGGANDTNPLDNRLLELQQILASAQQQQLNLATIDLRFGLRPVYTLKK